MSEGGPTPAGRTVLAALAAVAAAAIVVGLSLFAGVQLYDRLWVGSTSILVAVYLVFGVSGTYAGWLLALVVFAQARGDGAGSEADR